MKHRTWWMLVVCGLWPCVAVANDVQVQVSERGTNTYQVLGTMTVPGPLSVVWRVLTDYERIDEFVSSMETSRVRERRLNGALVEQVARNKGTLFAPRVSLLLDVTEQPFRRIAFRDVSHRDFLTYEGTWTLSAVGRNVTVQYRLNATPQTVFPNRVTRYAFHRTARSLLQEVVAEILRVQTVPPPPEKP